MGIEPLVAPISSASKGAYNANFAGNLRRAKLKLWTSYFQ
jgi:hypothetical protein